MSVSSLGRRLVACLLNISEARRRDLVETVARSAITDAHGRAREGVTVLNIFNDFDYNRSVITIVASIDLIREAVLSACQHACSIIDMNAHDGIHPCMGAVDLVPLYPLGEEVGLEDCGQEALALAKALTERVPGSSAFLFGWADSQHRSLAQRRKGIGWFKKARDISTIQPDIGPQPARRYGITGVGASPYTMNCNVTIDTQDLSLGRFLASAIRESSPNGIPGVQVIALPHEGAVEIACNVESVENPPRPQSLSYEGEPWPGFTIRGQNLYHAPASLITAQVAELARHHGVAIKGTALVGFTPCECRSMAEGALSKGIKQFWKKLPHIHM